jgi:T5SS/PEP-CTERM-associated repeat protein
VGSNAFTAANAGVAHVNIGNGGELRSDGGFIAKQTGSVATVTISGVGSFWVSALNINIGGDAITSGGNGTLMFADGGGALAPQVTVFADGTLGGNGTASGHVLSGGTVSPGTSPGHLIVGADYTQTSDGTLVIELGGDNAGVDFDLLEVGGDALLDGTLTVLLIDEFSPEAGDTFRFLVAAGVGGEFAVEDLPDFGGLTLDVVYGTDYVELGVIATAVPLPAGAWLLSSAFAVLLLRNKRERSGKRSIQGTEVGRVG